MNENAYGTEKVNNAGKSFKSLDEWIAVGNQQHDQAIFDFLVGLLTVGTRSVKRKSRPKGAADHSKKQFGLVT